MQRDWLFKKYSDDKLIVIDSDYEDEEDDTSMLFMPSHLASGLLSEYTHLIELRFVERCTYLIFKFFDGYGRL